MNSPWTISHEIHHRPAKRRNTKESKKDLAFSLILPFALAILGIPVYIAIILKLVAIFS